MIDNKGNKTFLDHPREWYTEDNELEESVILVEGVDYCPLLYDDSEEISQAKVLPK